MTYTGPTVFAGENRAEGDAHVAKVLADARDKKSQARLAGVKVGDTLIVHRPYQRGLMRVEVEEVRRKYLRTSGHVEYDIATGCARGSTTGNHWVETLSQHTARAERSEVQRDLGCCGVETLRARLTTDQLKRILAIAQEETP